jgi:hypothetical protein
LHAIEAPQTNLIVLLIVEGPKRAPKTTLEEITTPVPINEAYIILEKSNYINFDQLLE